MLRPKIQDLTRHLSPLVWLRFVARSPNLAAVLGYSALSCMYAWKVIIHFGTNLAGHGGDGYQNLWSLWWFSDALFSGKNPYFTDLLYHPTGTTLLFHALTPFNCVLAMPFAALFGQPIAYNIVFLFCFAASGFTMYLLVKELYGDAKAAFLAGCVFTFSNYHFAHAQGHLNLIAIEWLPLFLLALVKVWRQARIRDGVLLGVALALTTFCDLYYFIFGVMIALLAVLVQLVRRPRRVLDKQVILSIGAGVLTFMATGGILVVAMLLDYGKVRFASAHDPTFWSADLQGFFLPGWISAYAGNFWDIIGRWTGNNAECCWFLGYVPIGLTVAAFVWSGKGMRPWAWTGLLLLGMALALGPTLHWGGRLIEGVPMPYNLLRRVFPLIDMSGAPERFHFLSLIAMSVLAGAGAVALFRRLGRKKWLRVELQGALFVLLTTLSLVELAPQWIDSVPLRTASFLEDLKKEPGDFAVYDLGDYNEAMWRQVGHQRPMMGGAISRVGQSQLNFLRDSPALRTLRGEGALPAQELFASAAALGLRFVITPDASLRQKLINLGLRQRFADGSLVVLEIPWPG